ncbi:hypothetical protein AFE02nite_23800 [Actinotalea fermentans]|uniref:FAD/NAD(P)-binding domain-containing protein n=1 Tax=Actinotalea fermentans TaxID=43671 RepID=A0A511YZU9_9CELL|nr:hypothetical protein AFE02nite_23800 [Actinotalea fermentans]
MSLRRGGGQRVGSYVPVGTSVICTTGSPHALALAPLCAKRTRGSLRTGAGVRATVIFELETAGVFAVGDVRSGSVRRAASAVAEGAVALPLVHDHLIRAGRR